MIRTTKIILIAIFASAAILIVMPTSAHAALVNTTQNPPNLLTGLVGWWTFDGANLKTNVADSSGSGNNGSIIFGASGNRSTTTAVVAGKLGQAMKFDGADDYVESASNIGISGKQSRTISFWAKSNKTNYTVNGSAVNIGNIAIGDYYFEIRARLSPAYWVFSDGSNLQITTVPVKTSWQMITTTFNSSGNILNIYVDGVITNVVDVVLNNLNTTNSKVTIGRRTDSTMFFNGTLDDVRIYSRALSATEIKQLYNMGSDKINISPKVATTTCSTGLSCGLVGYWTFDGANLKNNVADSSGLGNNGRLVGFGATSSAVVAGKLGQAMKFDGVDDYAMTADSSSFDLTNMTFVSWVKWNGGSGYKSITSREVTNNQNRNWWFGVNGTGSTGVLSFGFSSGGVSKFDGGSGVISKNIWKHVAVTFSQPNIKYYIDGLEADSATLNFTPDMLNTGVAIGNTKDEPMLFGGSIDDVRIYSRALSATEIKQLYNMGADKINTVSTATAGGTTLKSGLVGWWTFDGANLKTNVADSSGSGNNGNIVFGTLGNKATTTAVVAGKLGQALKFDGVDDYVTASFGSTLVPQDITVSAWVKPRTFSATTNRGLITGKVFGTFLVYVMPQSIMAFVNPSGSYGTLTATVPSLTANVWTHVAVVYINQAPKTLMKIYANGQLMNSGTDPIFDGVLQNITGVKLGTWSSNQYLDGTIDDARIYNRALTAQEIKQLYNMGR